MSDFEIFEAKARYGQEKSLATQYPDRLMVKRTISGYTALSSVVVEFLRLKKGSRMIFSIRDEVFHLAVVPECSKLRGYALTYMPAPKSSFFMNKFVLTKGLRNGTYELGKPEYVNGIDWFPLNFVK